ncbi:uncharacterized protein SPSK_10827 [Sporothrix schenckii 1099-18]|uniref:Uncharacterized protein n=1 Tax=Sporothrix schenckii 1099-18 TaxID=1397361 RepID=A0A0F2MKJ6_SPOSC|nr:uncharacterized protein SPSK_10827 [Sporothrix schenckii 1099-18]KJR88711.1 hypothetical protein SPSK_10827 [Sporothrix schenckii 1099-18]
MRVGGEDQTARLTRFGLEGKKNGQEKGQATKEGKRKQLRTEHGRDGRRDAKEKNEPRTAPADNFLMHEAIVSMVLGQTSFLPSRS